MPRGHPKRECCYNCRWWERSYNYKARERDWGDCHFWGQREGVKLIVGFLDTWVGASPRGSDKCGGFDMPPEMIGKINPSDGPRRPRGDE